MHLIVVFSEKFSLRTVARSKLEVQRLVEATTQNQSGRWLAHFFGSSKAVAPVFEKHFFFRATSANGQPIGLLQTSPGCICVNRVGHLTMTRLQQRHAKKTQRVRLG